MTYFLHEDGLEMAHINLMYKSKVLRFFFSMHVYENNGLPTVYGAISKCVLNNLLDYSFYSNKTRHEDIKQHNGYFAKSENP